MLKGMLSLLWLQIGILPYAGVDIAAFEILKEELLEHYQGTPPPIAILGAGMVSSSIAQFVSYPLALVRTRLQVSFDLASHLTVPRRSCVCRAITKQAEWDVLSI